MSAFFSRLSPSGRHVVSGEHVVHLNWMPLRSPSFPGGLPGTSPQWFDENTIFYTRQPDGVLMRVVPSEDPTPVFGGGYNEWHTQGGRLVGWPAPHGLRGPTVSSSGSIAGVRDLGGAGELVLNGEVIDQGHIFDPRFTGDVLVWSKAEGRRHTYGKRSTVAPIELLSVDTEQDEFWPIAIETPVGLFLLNHGHDRCFVRPWGAHRVSWSVIGVTDYPDARMHGATIRVVASERGVQKEFAVDPAAPLTDLYPPAPSPTPVPAPTPQPPPPEPKEPTVSIPNLSRVVQGISNNHPHLLAANTKESMTELLWRVAYELHTFHDEKFGLLSKSPGENGVEIPGAGRVAVDALAYQGSDEIVDIFRAAHDGVDSEGETLGAITWNVDERRPSNQWVKPPRFAGSQPRPDPVPMPGPDPRPVPNPTPDPTPAPGVLGEIDDVEENQLALIAAVSHLADTNERLIAAFHVNTEQVIGLRQDLKTGLADIKTSLGDGIRVRLR